MNEVQQVERSLCDNESIHEQNSNSKDTVEVSVDAESDDSITLIESPLNRPRRKCRTKKKEVIPNLNYELMNALNIIQYLMSPTIKSANWPFLEEHLPDGSKEAKRTMWLSKVKSLLLEGKYKNITEVVRDIRLIFENCYRSYNSSHALFKRALKLEMLLEQKLALLTRKIKEKTLVELTSMPLIKESGVFMENKRSLNSLSNDASQILFYVNKIKAKMQKEKKKKQFQVKKVGRKAKYLGVIDWENELVQEHSVVMKAMWELPQIGHFLFLAQKILNIPELHMFALERVFLMPRESIYLATIITSLLSSPYQRTKLNRKPPMPYRIWHERLKFRVQNWYKLYNAKHRNTRKVFDIVGIEPDFFKVLGDTNPLQQNGFHELTYHQRVWLVKSLCDHCLHSHKTIQDAISENTWLDQKELILGVDRNNKRYIHFPQFCGLDLRIYRQSICKTFQTPDFILHSKSSLRKKAKGNAENNNIKISKRNKKKEIHPDIENFELVVDGLESLRNLILEFSEVKDFNKKKGKNERPQCEIQLYHTLSNLLEELEPWESKLQQVARRARVRLKKEWDNYKLKVMKGEEQETSNNVWDNEPDEEQSNLTLYANNNEDSVDYNDYTDNEDSSEEENYGVKTRRAQRKRCFSNKEDNKVEEIDYSSEFEVSISSRGRVRKIRKINTVSEEYQRKTSKTNNQKEKLPVVEKKEDISEIVDQAKGQYEWETLRQIILSNKEQTPEQKGQMGNANILNKSVLHQEEKSTCDTAELQYKSAISSSVSSNPQMVSSECNINQATGTPTKLKMTTLNSNYLPCSYATASTSSNNSNDIPQYLNSESKLSIPISLSNPISNIPLKSEAGVEKKIEDKQTHKDNSSDPLNHQINENPKIIIEGKKSPHLHFYNLKLPPLRNNCISEQKSSIQSKPLPQLLSIVDPKGNKIYLQCIPLTQNTESMESKGGNKEATPHISLDNSAQLNKVDENQIYLKDEKDISPNRHLRDTVMSVTNTDAAVGEVCFTQPESIISSIQPSFKSVQIIGNASALSSEVTESKKSDPSSLHLLHLSPLNSVSTKKNETPANTLTSSQPQLTVTNPSINRISAPANNTVSKQIPILTPVNSKLEHRLTTSSTPSHPNIQFTLLQQPTKFNLQLSSVICDKSSGHNNVGNNSSGIKTVPNILVKQKQVNPVQVLTMNSNSANMQFKQCKESPVNGIPSLQDSGIVQYQLPILKMNSGQIKLHSNQNFGIKEPSLGTEEQTQMTVISPPAVGNSTKQNEISGVENKKSIPVDHIYT